MPTETYPNDYPDRGIIAETPWSARLDGYGDHRCLYRVRRLSEAEVYAFPEHSETRRRFHRWTLETYHDRRRGDGTEWFEPISWEVWNTAATARGAVASCIGDSRYLAAESRHPWHAEAVAEYHARRARSDEAETLRKSITGLGLDPEPYVRRTGLEQEAERRFHAALKRARIYTAAQQGTAPATKLDPIRAEITAWFREEKTRRESDRDRMVARLAELTNG